MITKSDQSKPLAEVLKTKAEAEAQADAEEIRKPIRVYFFGALPEGYELDPDDPAGQAD